jgi:type IV secretory pathway component VirB8
MAVSEALMRNEPVRIDRGMLQQFWTSERLRYRRESLLVVACFFGILAVVAAVSIVANLFWK